MSTRNSTVYNEHIKEHRGAREHQVENPCPTVKLLERDAEHI
jgi:hypothetical protein